MSKTEGETPARAARARRPKAKPTDDLEAGLEQTVATYLCAHPDFFERHSEILANLKVPHAPEGSVSLIERQVKVLRKNLDTERGRLAQLIARAREYETLSARLHALVLDLIAAADLDRVRAVLTDALTREFKAEAVTLKLFPVAPLAAETEQDPLTAAFREFLTREHALCGPLDEQKNEILFGDLGSEVRCAALVPIRGGDCSGVLAIGAADPERFKPDMRTDMLDRLGEIVGHKLRMLPASPPAGEPGPRRTRRPSKRRTESGTAIAQD